MTEASATYTTGPSGHAKYGPSSLRYREICPGWQHSLGTSYAAEEGTAMHAAAETGDLSKLTPEQRGQVEDALAYVAGIEDGAAEVHKEIKLDVAGLTWGTADRVIITNYGEWAHVVDFKFGRNDVDNAETNLQGWAYAVGAFTRWPLLGVTVHFIVPRRDSYHKASFMRDEVPRMTERIRQVIARAESAGVSDYAPDEKNCLYCGRKAECPALTGKAVAIAKGAGMNVPAILDPSAIADPRQMAECLNLVPVISAWCDAVKAAALERARNGAVLPGYELAHRAGKRVVRDLLPAWQTLNQEFGLELQEFLPACSVSIGEIEMAVKAKAEKGEGAKALRKLSARFAELGIVTTAQDVEYLRKTK